MLHKLHGKNLFSTAANAWVISVAVSVIGCFQLSYVNAAEEATNPLQELTQIFGALQGSEAKDGTPEEQALRYNQLKKEFEGDDDIVRKVLNYSTFGEDEGTEVGFWYPVERAECSYEVIKNPSLSPFFSPILQTVRGHPDSVILNTVDPRNIKIETVMASNIYNYDYHEVYAVDLDKKGTFQCLVSRCDRDRLIRGWSMVFSKFCSGFQKDF
ncbi:MAG: hypothetical protein KFB96_07430 [Thiocapsa sp.]|uniref:hypothetical protein n=1 Tax=Thiocapsa sp. TaxID=2024551 RepID=UPI001BCF8E0C|nr:hypothetical protein [Thiocapsa sp.]QVL50260.1 MAG: hypothetical protein KFB96_07430 [Thiocapsa sp.]